MATQIHRQRIRNPIQDGANVDSLDFLNRLLKDTANITVLDYNIRRAYDNTGVLAMRFDLQRLLVRSDGSTTIDWDNTELRFAGLPTLLWSAGRTYDGGGVISIYWQNRLLNNAANVVVFDWSTNLEVSDAINLVFNAGTGSKIGTATGQKIGFWNATPIIQPTTAIAAGAFVANTSGIADDTATFDGYTIGQIAAALRSAGLLA